MTWTKSDIRLARKADLVSILSDRSYRLHPLGNGNFRILPDPDDPAAPSGVVVKESFWIWGEKNIAGNAIDFFTHVEGKTFHDAMRIITEWQHYDAARQHLREKHGNEAKILR
jgi:hypothetical protein